MDKMQITNVAFTNTDMGGPSIPSGLPPHRLSFVSMRSISQGDDLEPRTFLFLTDTQEWVAQDAEEAAVIREAHQEAKINLASALSE